MAPVQDPRSVPSNCVRDPKCPISPAPGGCRAFTPLTHMPHTHTIKNNKSKLFFFLKVTCNRHLKSIIVLLHTKAM